MSWRPYLLTALLAIVSGAAILLAMGRLPICKCGTIAIWYGNTYGPGNSQHLTDWYTFSHIIHGFIFYWFLRLVAPRLPMPARFLIAVVLEIIWEVFENTPFTINRYRTETLALDYYGDSVINSVMDMLSAGLGFILAWRWPVWLSLLFIIGAELLVGYLVRDNLTLNVIMLIYPMEAIKAWQLAL